MGIVNHFKGLESTRKIYNFNGRLRANLDMGWDHAKIFKGSIELDPDYEVQEDDVILIQEYPGASAGVAIMLTLAVVSLAVGIGTGIYAAEQAKIARKEMEEALNRIGKSNNQKDITSIPQMGDARNERADGKNIPIILGRHLFAPYFISEPYLRPSTDNDGADLYWYATFLCGQDGLCFENIRNGTNNLVTFSGDKAQSGLSRFDVPLMYDPKDPPPFYDPENFIEIAQKEVGFTSEQDSHIFEEKWTDSLDGSVEIGRKKKDNAEIVDDIFIDDDGVEPVIRETARFPYKAEIEIFVDGLHGWDSVNGVPTQATVGLTLEWDTDPEFSKPREISLGFPVGTVPEGITEYPSSTRIANLVNSYIPEILSNSGSVPKSITREMPLGIRATFGDKTVTRVMLVKNNALGDGGYLAGPFHTMFIYFSDNTSRIISTRAVGTMAVPTITLGSALKTWSSYLTTNLLTRNSTRQMRFVGTAEFFKEPSEVYNEEGSPVYIRATRTTKMHTGGYRDRVYLSAIRTQQYNPYTSSETELIPAKNINDTIKNKVCRMGIKLKVNQNTDKFLDRFSIIASMTGRTWNNGWSDIKTKTSNSAAVLLELLMGLIHIPSRHDEDDIDKLSIGKLYEFCNEQKVKIKGISEPVKCNLECNGVLTSGTRKIDVIKSILATCDGGLYINEYGKLKVYFDDKQSTPIALLNPQRIIKMVENRSLDLKPDGYTVEFIDANSGWFQSTHSILRPGIKVIPGLNTHAPLKLDFTTSYNQAMWHARRMMAKEIHRPGEIKITVGKEGRYYEPGSLIKVQHERFKKGLGSGEITEVLKKDGEIIGFKLMERFDISKDRDYFVEYYIVDIDRNRVIYPQPETVNNPDTKRKTMRLQSVGEYTDTLMLVTPIPADDFYTPEYGNILSVIHGERTEMTRIWESDRYKVAGLSEIEDGYEMTIVPYSDVIYDTTLIDEIPLYQSSILTTPPAVYDSMGRKPIDGESGQGLPDNKTLSGVVNNIPETVSTNAPRYMGMYSVKGITEDGVGSIDGITVNTKDWVSYIGITGEWNSGFCYRWDGVWDEIPMSETAPYMAALQDLTAGAPDGVFSTIFAQRLMALEATIASLEAEVLRLRNPDNRDEYIELNGGLGLIKSSNFDKTDEDGNPLGFIIEHNGDVKFNSAVFRGRLDSAVGIFSGNLNAASFTAGALSVIPGEPQSQEKKFSLYTNANEITRQILDLPNSIIALSADINNMYDVIGNYNGTITKLEIATTIRNSIIPYFPNYVRNIYVYRNNQRINIARTTVVITLSGTHVTHDFRTSYLLSFSITLQSMIVKFSGLPVYPYIPEEAGTAYLRRSTLSGTEQDYVLIVKS